MTQLYNNGEIVYDNGRNGTWFDWNINDKTSWFTVCFNDKKRMGYLDSEGITLYNKPDEIIVEVKDLSSKRK